MIIKLPIKEQSEVDTFIKRLQACETSEESYELIRITEQFYKDSKNKMNVN